MYFYQFYFDEHNICNSMTLRLHKKSFYCYKNTDVWA